MAKRMIVKSLSKKKKKNDSEVYGAGMESRYKELKLERGPESIVKQLWANR